MKKKEIINVILSIAGWMGGWLLATLFWPEKKNLSGLVCAILGALAYAFCRFVIDRRYKKEKEKAKHQ